MVEYGWADKVPWGCLHSSAYYMRKRRRMICLQWIKNSTWRLGLERCCRETERESESACVCVAHWASDPVSNAALTLPVRLNHTLLLLNAVCPALAHHTHCTETCLQQKPLILELTVAKWLKSSYHVWRYSLVGIKVIFTKNVDVNAGYALRVKWITVFMTEMHSSKPLSDIRKHTSHSSLPGKVELTGWEDVTLFRGRWRCTFSV